MRVDDAGSLAEQVDGALEMVEAAIEEPAREKVHRMRECPARVRVEAGQLGPSALGVTNVWGSHLTRADASQICRKTWTRRRIADVIDLA